MRHLSFSTTRRFSWICALGGTLLATLGAAPAARSGDGGHTCLGAAATIVGTAGSDTLNGTKGNDVIAALDGADVVNGLGGDDVICGGFGNDRLDGGAGADTVSGDLDDDQVAGGSDDDILEGHGGNDVVDGGPGNDFLDGGQRGCCAQEPNTGSDSLLGGDGNDELWSADFGRVSMVGGAGNDLFHGLGGDDTIDSRDGVFGNDSGGAGPGKDRCDIDDKDAISECETIVVARQTLTVSVSGTGRVTGSGIDCPGDCGEQYPPGTNVSLSAAPGNGMSFTGWGGDCSGTSSTCTVALTADRSVTSTFAPTPAPNRTLTVAVSGTGRVTASGIDCPGDCTQEYTSGTTVQLTAAPGTGMSFTGWGGACSGASTTCTVAMTAGKSVTATFAPVPPANRLLTVSVTGTGRVTGSGIDCPSDCSQEYAVGTGVQLTAAGVGGTTFTGWSGDCSGAVPTCAVAMSANRGVTATFAQIPAAKRLLSVTADGSGRVTGSGIDCPGDCTQEHDLGAPVILTAVPAPDFSVTWGGDCAAAGTATTCSLTMSDTRSVVATFSSAGRPDAVPSIGTSLPDPLPPLPPPAVEQVLVKVDGNGTVTSTPAGRTLASAQAAKRINCGVGGWDCYAEYRPGEALALTAKAAPGYVFKRWAGACSGSTETCRIVLSDARSVTAVFAAKGGGAAVAAKLRDPRLDVRWTRSIGAGRLVIKGSTSRAARARIDMRRPGGGPLATLKLKLSGGSFTRTLPLRSGALAGGAKLFPGGFTVALTGRAGNVRLPLQVQTIAIQAPQDGVVRQAFRSRKREGTSVPRFTSGTTEVWANFRFETQPAARLALTVRWYYPDGRVLGEVKKSNRPVVSSYMSLPTGLQRGLWKAELRAGNRVVHTLSIPID